LNLTVSALLFTVNALCDRIKNSICYTEGGKGDSAGLAKIFVGLSGGETNEKGEAVSSNNSSTAHCTG